MRCRSTCPYFTHAFRIQLLSKLAIDLHTPEPADQSLRMTLNPQPQSKPLCNSLDILYIICFRRSSPCWYPAICTPCRTVTHCAHLVLDSHKRRSRQHTERNAIVCRKDRFFSGTALGSKASVPAKQPAKKQQQGMQHISAKILFLRSLFEGLIMARRTFSFCGETVPANKCVFLQKRSVSGVHLHEPYLIPRASNF